MNCLYRSFIANPILLESGGGATQEKVWIGWEVPEATGMCFYSLSSCSLLTKLASYSDRNTTRIYDIADLAAKHRNASHAYEPVPQDMRDEWWVGQDNELLFWVSFEHREVLFLPHVEMIRERPLKVDLFNFKFGTEWTECIDQEWMKELEERGGTGGKLLEWELKTYGCAPLSTFTILL